MKMLTPIDYRLLGSVGLGVPAAYYLLSSGPEKKPHGDHGDHHEAVKETEKKEEQAPAGESEPQPDRDAEQKVEAGSSSSSAGEKGGSFGEPPSNVDEVRPIPFSMRFISIGLGIMVNVVGLTIFAIGFGARGNWGTSHYIREAGGPLQYRHF